MLKPAALYRRRRLNMKTAVDKISRRHFTASIHGRVLAADYSKHVSDGGNGNREVPACQAVDLTDEGNVIGCPKAGGHSLIRRGPALSSSPVGA